MKIEFILFAALIILSIGSAFIAWWQWRKNMVIRGQWEESMARQQSFQIEKIKIEEELKHTVFSAQKYEQLNKSLEMKNQSLERDIVSLQVDKINLSRMVDEQKEFVKNSVDQLEKTFRGLASQALEGNSREFLGLAQHVFFQEAQTHKTDSEKREQNLQLLLEPIRQTLNKYQDFTREIELERKKSYSALGNELQRVAHINNSLLQTTSALKDALKKPHVRGRWGELQLKNCIELAGMSPYADVTMQDARNLCEGGRLIPDMTVRMPGGRVVVVDAKTPIDAFIGSLDAQDPAAREIEMLRHGRHVKEHIKKLSARSYGEALPDSADFTIMFLPNESFLYAALECEPDLVEFALQRKILIATPPTLVGLLKVIRFGWNEEKLAANALKISEVGKELHKRLGDFMEAFAGLGKAIERAQAEYGTAVMRLESRVLVQARKLERLGVKSHKTIDREKQHVGETDNDQEEEETQIQV